MAGSFAAAIGRLSAELDGWRPAEIDVGGGYAAPRDPTGPGDPAPPIEDVAAAITSGLRDGLAAAGIDPAGIRLEAEPGRALYADCGIHLATVRNLKHQAAPVAMRWVETDTTEMFMADLLIEHARFGVIDASQADSPTTETADVVGMSCGFDVLVPDARLPKVRTGDVLAFLDTGAYQDACASNFNGLPRPGHGARLGRERRVDQAARDGRGRVRAGRRPGAARVIGGLHHVGITVSDLDRSLAFYRDLLGLHIEARAVDVAAEDVTGIPGARVSIADLDLPDGRLLELIQYTAGGGRPLTQRTSDPGACHVAIAVDDIDATYERLERAGVTLRSKPVTLTDSGPRWDGSRVVYTVDPDGVTVELVQAPPV